MITMLASAQADPFGLRMSGENTLVASPGNEYLYNGKELQTELGLGWYDYGARMYAPDEGRWKGVDALAEKYVGWSPYNYVINNPLVFIDPDGRNIDNFYFNADGDLVARVKNDKPDKFFIQKGEDCDVECDESVPLFDELNFDSDLGHMVRTVYAEAQGENLTSKQSVAEVIRNRANDDTPNSKELGWTATFSDESTYTEVVTKTGFQTVNNNVDSYSNPLGQLIDDKGKRIESETTSLVESVTASIRADKGSNISDGSVYFFSPYIPAPNWTKSLEEVNIKGVDSEAFRFFKFPQK
ncbi:MAG: RHS repeat-associated core domain-containing protein [Bacteroidia bacterium]